MASKLELSMLTAGLTVWLNLINAVHTKDKTFKEKKAGLH